MTSATYRQRSEDRQAARIDAGNRLWWRMNRRKLEAEAVRDALLMTVGRLDLRMGGPSFRDFVVEKAGAFASLRIRDAQSTDPASQRRSIYRWIVPVATPAVSDDAGLRRSSMQVARRNESTSPLQALAVLNNGLVLSLSREAGALHRRARTSRRRCCSPTVHFWAGIRCHRSRRRFWNMPPSSA